MTGQAAYTSPSVESGYSRLEPRLPLTPLQTAQVRALNAAAAEMAGVTVQTLPVVALQSGMRHDDPFKFAVLPPQRPFRLASNDLPVVLSCLAREMGITAAYRRHSQTALPG